jgi:hypothetical protein
MFMGLGKWIMTYTHCYSITKDNFIDLISPLSSTCSFPFLSLCPPPTNAGNNLSFYHLCKCAFFRMPCWNHTVCSPSDWLPSHSNMNLSFFRIFSLLACLFAVLGIQLRPWCLLGSCSTSMLLFLLVFQIGSWANFARVGILLSSF